MKKSLLTIAMAFVFTLGVNAQLFKPADVAKLSDYVVKELQLTGAPAQKVKSLYAEYGEKMRVVMESNEGLNAKQAKVKGLTDEMDSKVKETLPATKKADYDVVANHYRTRGVATSALNNKSAASGNSQSSDVPTEKADKLKADIIKELAVNENDANQLVSITLEHNAQKKENNQTYKSDAVKRAQVNKQLDDQTNVKIKKILDEQQYKKFLVILIRSGLF